MRTLIIAATSIALLAVPAISMASAYLPHYRVTSLTATPTHHGTSYVHSYTLTTGENHSFTGIASAGSINPGETVRGTRHHSETDITSAYPNGYTWSYDGPIAGSTETDGLGLEWNIAFTTTKSLVNPIPVAQYHVNHNDVEWSADSSLSLHTESDG